jgi:hypothetical protein
MNSSQPTFDFKALAAMLSKLCAVAGNTEDAMDVHCECDDDQTVGNLLALCKEVEALAAGALHTVNEHRYASGEPGFGKLVHRCDDGTAVCLGYLSDIRVAPAEPKPEPAGVSFTITLPYSIDPAAFGGGK